MRAGARIDADFVFRILPKRPFVSWNPRHGVHRVARDEAIGAPYVVLQSETHVNWLTLDIDRPVDVAEFLDAVDLLGLPAPAFLVRNETGGKSAGRLHATWCLATPVQIGPSGRARPQAYFRRVRMALAAALGGDPGFTNLLTKNPLGSGTNEKPTRTYWTGGRAIDLREIGDRLDLSSHRAAVSGVGEIDTAGLGRNCGLFARLRARAYRRVDAFRASGDRSGFELDLAAAATGENAAFDRSLPPKEVDGIVRSVAKWTWLHYRGSRKGTDGPSGASGASVDGRRQAGARRLVARRGAFLTEVQRRARRGESLAIDDLSRATGIPRRTAQRYLRVFQAMRKTQKTSSNSYVNDMNSQDNVSAPRSFPSGSAPDFLAGPLAGSERNFEPSAGTDPPDRSNNSHSRSRKPSG
ncbi:MAG: replication initiation protein [Azospirillum sp.]|nr:replication initiation protein [Azospirillum sp.]